MIFVTILGLFLAPFRDKIAIKIAATSDHMRFLTGKCSKMCLQPAGALPRTPLGELTSLPSAANLFTVDSRRVVPAR